MVRQQQTHNSWKIVTYNIAKWTWLVTTWIWSTIIIGFLVQVTSNLVTDPNPQFIQNTWASTAMHWLLERSNVLSQEIPRLAAICAAFLLVVLPLLAFLFKQMLQDIQQDGLDKIVEVLQKDTISSQLELLQERLDQQVQMQTASIEVLQHISGLLQQAPVSSTLQAWHTSSLQQQDTCQKELSSTLQDIQIKNSEQMQQLINLYRQDQHTQEQISVDLRNVSFLLQRMLDRPPGPGQREKGSLSNWDPITGPVTAGMPPLQIGQLPSSVSQYTTSGL